METIRGKTTAELQQIKGTLTEELHPMQAGLEVKREILVAKRLNDLEDITISNPKNGEVLGYEDGVWKNKKDEGSTIETVDEDYLQLEEKELTLSEAVKSNLNNFGADNKLIDNALSINVTNKLANFDENNKLKDSALSNNVTDRLGELDENKEAGFLKSSNIWDEQWELGRYNIQSSGKGAKIEDSARIRCKNPIEVKANTTYYVVFPSGVEDYNYVVLDASFNALTNNGALSSKGTITTPTNAKYLLHYMDRGYGTTYKHDIAIIEGASGEYQPYAESNVKLTEKLSDNTNAGFLKSINILDIKNAPISNNSWHLIIGCDLKKDHTYYIRIYGDIAYNINFSYKTINRAITGGSGFLFTPDEDVTSITIGTTNVSLVGKEDIIRNSQFLIAESDSPIAEYVPYYKSNNELTKELEYKTIALPLKSGVTLFANKVEKAGRMVSITLELYSARMVVGANATMSLGTLPAEYRPSVRQAFVCANIDASKGTPLGIGNLMITTDGDVSIANGDKAVDFMYCHAVYMAN